MSIISPLQAGQSLAEHFILHSQAAFGFDIDGTLTFMTKPENHICATFVAAPDAHVPDQIPSILADLKNHGLFLCAVTGRPIIFANEHFGLQGAGQFGHEMILIGSSSLLTLSPEPDFVEVTKHFDSIVAKFGNSATFTETDKSYYKGIMCIEVTDALKADVTSIFQKSTLGQNPEVTIIWRNDEFEIGLTPKPKLETLKSIMNTAGWGESLSYAVFAGDTPETDGSVMAYIQTIGGIAVAIGKKDFGFEPTIRLKDAAEFQTALQTMRDILQFNRP